MNTVYVVFVVLQLVCFGHGGVPEEDWNEENSKVHEINSLVAEHVISQANIPIAFHMQSPVNPFIGRDEELSELKWSHADKKMVILTGTRGVGKTELARKYAQEFKHDNMSSTIWLDSETHEVLIASLKDVAVLVGIKIEGKKVTSIIRELFQHFSNRKSLFIFDNSAFDNGIVSNLPSFIHNSDFIHFIVTSRDETWDATKFKMIKLNPFTKEEAKEYIKTTLKKINLVINDESCEKMAELLKFLPLYIKEASAHIIQQNSLNPSTVYSIDDFIKSFERKEIMVATTPAPVVIAGPTDEQIEDVLSHKVEREVKRVGNQITNEAKRFEKRVKKWFG